MRNMITIINLAILFGITSIFSNTELAQKKSTPKPDAAEKRLANEGEDIGIIQSNFTVWPIKWTDDEDLDTNTDVNEELARFIEEITGTRMLDLEHIKVASQRATKRPLKDYAAAVVTDETEMLQELNALADKKKIRLPKDVANTNTFKDIHGESFDKRFITLSIKDHKRNVKKLEKATRSKDADVQVFATKYLPVVQSHLDLIKAIKKTY